MPASDPNQGTGGLPNRALLYVLPVPGFFSQTGHVGGHISHAYGVVEALAEQGYAVDIVAEEPDPVLENASRRYLILPSAAHGILGRQLWNLHVLSSLKKIVGLENYDFVYCRYSVGFAPWIGRLRSITGRIPLVLEVNSIGSSRRGWLSPLESRALAQADLLVCVSRNLMEQMAGLLGRRITAKMFLMPNAVRPELFAEPQLPDSALPECGPIKVGYAGVFKAHYNLDVLAQAVALARDNGLDAQLHLAGDGPLRPALQETLFNREWVFDHGNLDFEQVPDFLGAMDILVCPQSPDNKFQSPLKLFEYMAAGKPIIGADIPSVAELLGRGERGLLYQPDDARDLADKIEEMAADPERSRRIAARARQEVEANHTWQARLGTLLREMARRGLLP